MSIVKGQIVTNVTSEVNAECNELKVLNKKINNYNLIKEYSNIDTIFILFKESKIASKHKFLENKKIKDTSISYSYTIEESSTFGFTYRKYVDFDRRDLNISTLILEKHKSFLEENKSRIITNNFFIKKNTIETDFFRHVLYALFASKKMIFIIDEEEFRNDTIILRQVEIGDLDNPFFISRI